jgi:hypothetical protein
MARDSGLFGAVEDPLGTIDMNANKAVMVHGDGRGGGSITLTIAANVEGCDELTLDIQADGLADPTAADRERLELMLTATPEALVALSILLPRVVEVARREGLLWQPTVIAGGVSRA